MTLFALLVTLLFTHPTQISSIQVPAYTAYSVPDPEAIQFSEQEGVTQWKDPKQSLAWFGSLGVGELRLSLTLKLPAKETATYTLRVGRHTATRSATGEGENPVTVDFGAFPLSHEGYFRILLTGNTKTGETFGNIKTLTVGGGASINAHFSMVERRNAASVHLMYPVPKEAKVAWFYNEIRAKTTPLWSFYMACGFHRGYFGIQVNSPTERRIIFSVWDSGNEAVDRKNVKKEDLVQLLTKGENVVADSFGNEGTGGHSHKVFAWKQDTVYRFLLSAKPEGKTTIYTAYFRTPESDKWERIARFRAPKDGSYLKGLHSFNENFGGANGQERRLAEFRNGWIRTAEGKWLPLTEARFSHDSHGKKERKDYTAGSTAQGFFLSNGGFVAGNIVYGDTITRKPNGTPPPDAELPQE